MRDTIVALDIETTGLDPSENHIIEIGAVKFRGSEILDTWQTLIDPGCPIPPPITQLTGLTDGDIKGAPQLSDMLPQLRQFIDRDPLLGHNVRFDLAFLQSGGLRTTNPVIDTFPIASVMLPSVARYSLSSLASIFNVSTEGAHRALNDSIMTYEVYLRLWEQVLTLPLDTLAEIFRAGKQMTWDGALFFEAALRERSHETVSPSPEHIAEQEVGTVTDALPHYHKPVGAVLHPRQTPETIDTNKLAALIGVNGKLAAAFPNYEHRPQQISMLKTVSQAFNKGQHIMIEAPTGVGKSLAYLIPAVYFATQNDTRVVISTNTINLQEQLLNKDIPLLRTALEIPFRATVLKGRGNYLCPRRLAAMRRHGPTSPEEMHLLARILVWQTADQSGEKSGITLRGPIETALWRRLSAEDEGCKPERCAIQMTGTCPFYRARQAAETAHILIVNHALLLSDVATEGHVLPEYQHLIVDEAHHLEDATTNGLSFRTDPRAIASQLAELGTSSIGLLGEVLQRTQPAIPSGYYSTLVDFVNIVVQASSFMSQHVDLLFKTLLQFLEEHVRIVRNEYTQNIRIVESLRRQPAWEAVEVHWDNLSSFTSAIAEAMTRLAQGLHELEEYDIEEYDDLLAGTSAAARHLSDLHNRLKEIVSAPDSNTIYWAELQPGSEHISLHAAPLDIGPLVEQYLWNKKETIIMTSATLQTNGSFAYIRGRLNGQHIDEVALSSPFDYKSNTLLYIVNDIPEPANQTGYQQAVEQGILDLSRTAQGRTLALFTSYAQLRETASNINEALTRDGITLYDQADGISRMQMLDGFVQSEKAVLMGTRSFWEGVDIPGTDLSVLVIVRLPFNVPSDPIFAARSEKFDNPFMEYAVPETILRFRQGFGRLIRRKTDRGMVVIMDRRVISKRYGQSFLNSLPECTVKIGTLALLSETAAQWLG
ncbi:MAG: DEAD/DEAH box helicase [Anaerolineae bacterium]|nr:DEAD/DEAH box helicase [Anaerolineae bacterium]